MNGASKSGTATQAGLTSNSPIGGRGPVVVDILASNSVLAPLRSPFAIKSKASAKLAMLKWLKLADCTVTTPLGRPVVPLFDEQGPKPTELVGYATEKTDDNNPQDRTS